MQHKVVSIYSYLCLCESHLGVSVIYVGLFQLSEWSVCLCSHDRRKDKQRPAKI